MHSSAIGTSHATSTHGTAQPQLETDKAYLERLKTLVAPKRGFKQRLGDWFMGRHALGNSQLAYMGWLHGRIQETSKQRAEALKQQPVSAGEKKLLLENFVTKLFATRSDASRDPHELAKRISTEVGNNPREAREVLEACGFKEFSEMVRAKISDYRTLGDKELTVLADVAFAAVVSAVATTDEGSRGGVRQEIEAAFSRHADAETPEDLSASLRNIEQRLNLAVLLSPEAKKAYVERLDALRNAPPPDADARIRNTIALAMEGLNLKHDPTDLENRVFQLNSIIARLQSPHRWLSDKQREALKTHANEQQAVLLAIQTRTAHLAKLKSIAPQLHEQLQKLDTLQPYVEARRSLDHIVRTLGTSAETHVLALLSENIRSLEALPWLTEIRKGHPDIIDMIFCGAEWHEEAYALKRSPIPDDDRQALHELDIQHNLRLASFSLDQAMQAGQEKPEWSLAGFFGARRKTQPLPNNLFRATQADEAMIGWLAKHADLEDKNLLVASWLLLSLQRPLPPGYREREGAMLTQGKRQQDLGKMLATLFTEDKLKALGLTSLDAEQIRAFVKQGFSSVSAVVACRQRIEDFAYAIQNAALVGKLDEARDPRFKAELLACRLFERVTGISTETSDGSEMQQQMRKRLEAIVPKSRLTDEALIAMNSGVVSSIRSKHGNSDLVEQLDERQQTCTERIDELGRLPAFTFNTTIKNRKKALKAEIKKLNTEIAGLRLAIPDMQKLKGLELELADLKKKVPLAKGEKDYYLAARDLAILQEAVSLQQSDFRPCDHAGAILGRLRAFGLDPSNANPHVKAVLQNITQELTRDERSLATICDSSNLKQGLHDVKSRLFGGKSVASGSVQQVEPDPGEKRRLENRAVVKRNFEDLKEGGSFSIQFGTYGEVSLSASVLPGMSAGSSHRIERGNSITFHRGDDQRWSVSLGSGSTVRHGVSIGTVGEVLTASGYVQSRSKGGVAFDFPDRAACEAFALGLVSGEMLDSSLWADATISQESTQSRGVGGSVSATLDLSAASASLEGRVDAGVGYSTRASGSLQQEMFTRELRASATAALQAAGDLGGKEAGVATGLTEHRIVNRQFGVLTDASLVVACPVHGGNLERSLKEVFPAKMSADAAGWMVKLKGSIGEAPVEGAEVFMRYTLDRDAKEEAVKNMREANVAMFSARLTVDENKRAKLLAEAQQKREKASAIARDPANYVPEGLGWTSKDLVEVTRRRGLDHHYARGELMESGFLRMEGAAGSPPALIR